MNKISLSYTIERIVAFLIDFFIVCLIQSVIVFFLYISEVVYLITNLGSVTLENLFVILSAFFTISFLAILLSCLYFPVCTKFLGNTVGRKLMKLKIVRYDDAELSFSNIYMRELGKYLLIELTFGLELLFFFLNSKGLTLHDRIFKTKIIKII